MHCAYRVWGLTGGQVSLWQAAGGFAYKDAREESGGPHHTRMLGHSKELRFYSKGSGKPLYILTGLGQRGGGEGWSNFEFKKDCLAVVENGQRGSHGAY